MKETYKYVTDKYLKTSLDKSLRRKRLCMLFVDNGFDDNQVERANHADSVIQ